MSGLKADYVLVGGGSGGHLTPLIPVAQSLKMRDESLVVVHIGHKNDPLNRITRDSSYIDATYEVSAGKLRRYHGQSIIARMLDVKTNALNLRDAFRFTIGIYQSWRLLGKLKPKAILMKGGYVSANVGIAARIRRIPYMTHDSDAMVSLAHRIIAKGASMHATALPPEHYLGYDQDKTAQVGVPINPLFKAVSESDQQAAKKQIGLPISAKVVLITGGGLGARNLNNAVSSSAEKILADPDVYLIHLSGGKLYEEVVESYAMLPDSIKNRIKVEAFTSTMHLYSAAADIIITRAGMTALTEFAAQSKACIIVPNPLLSGGHQLKNADALISTDAVAVVSEESLELLAVTVLNLLKDADSREKLGVALHKSAVSGAADTLAKMLAGLEKVN